MTTLGFLRCIRPVFDTAYELYCRGSKVEFIQSFAQGAIAAFSLVADIPPTARRAHVLRVRRRAFNDHLHDCPRRSSCLLRSLPRKSALHFQKQ